MEDGEEARISYRNDIVPESFSIEHFSIKISFSSIKTVYRRAVYLKHPSVVS